MPAATRTALPHRLLQPLLQRCLAAALASPLAACSPALDWRELSPEASGALALFPCKPQTHRRDIRLDGRPLQLSLHACTAGDGASYALAVAEVGDPAQVPPTLQALLAHAAANIGAWEPQPLPLAVAGATPMQGTQRVALSGRRGDGRPLQSQVAVFSKGRRVYQATVLGQRLDGEAAETFFGALRTP